MLGDSESNSTGGDITCADCIQGVSTSQAPQAGAESGGRAMRFEVTIPGDQTYVCACQRCADRVLARVPGAFAVPEPAAPDCELQYDGCEHVSAPSPDGMEDES